MWGRPVTLESAPRFRILVNKLHRVRIDLPFVRRILEPLVVRIHNEQFRAHEIRELFERRISALPRIQYWQLFSSEMAIIISTS